MLSSEISPNNVGEFFLYISDMKTSEIFEEFFIAAVIERVESASFSHSEFGRRVFGSESGARLWRAVREKERKRAVSIGEAYAMAEALGIELPALIWEILQAAKARGILT